MSEQWAFQSVTQLQEALASGRVTSRQLVEYFRERIAQFNSTLNAVVATDFDAALKAADDADAARSRGESLGPLHGVPMTIKDTFEVAGMPCPAGEPVFAKHIPETDAFAVMQLKQAGAIIMGKTNVPPLASDIQSYNKIYGTTHNPWDLTRTPGGSSGGAAASLAAGMTPIELGSDLAGSIRTPASFCGIYGHKPTYGITSMRGHIPGKPGMLREPDMAVTGPLATSAGDLAVLMNILAAPLPSMGEGWSLKLPEAAKQSLSDYKVLLWISDKDCEVDNELLNAYRSLAASLSAQGATVTEGSPVGMSLNDFYPVYMQMLGSVLSPGMSRMQRKIAGMMGKAAGLTKRFMKTGKDSEKVLVGIGQEHAQWIRLDETRQKLREQFSEVFDQYDLVLMPVTMSAAMPHQQKPPVPARKVSVNGEPRPYTDMFMWVAPATLTGLPATSAPVGKTSSGLPVNIQIVGGLNQDMSCIRFAGLLEETLGKFVPPEGY